MNYTKDSLRKAISVQLYLRTLEGMVAFPKENRCCICEGIGAPKVITNLLAYANELHELDIRPDRIVLVSTWLCHEHLEEYERNLISLEDIAYSGLVALHKNPLSIQTLPDTILRQIIEW